MTIGKKVPDVSNVAKREKLGPTVQKQRGEKAITKTAPTSTKRSHVKNQTRQSKAEEICSIFTRNGQ